MKSTCFLHLVEFEACLSLTASIISPAPTSVVGRLVILALAPFIVLLYLVSTLLYLRAVDLARAI